MSKVNLTIVATVNPNGMKELAFYKEHVAKLYEKVDAKPVSKYTVSDSLIGDYKPTMVAIMEFADRSSLHSVFDSEEYKKLLPYRDQAFSKLEAYISE